MGMEKAVTDVIIAVKPELWWMLLQASTIFIVVIILKKIFENLAAYFMFRYNKNLSCGTRVVINNMEGVIENFDKSNIYIKITGGHHLVMPIARWRYHTWIIKDFSRELTEEKEC